MTRRALLPSGAATALLLAVLFQNPDNLHLIMKGGVVYKQTL